MTKKSTAPAKPAYLMTLEEYQAEVTPIIQEYNKFIRKSAQYYKQKDYNGVRQITWKEVVEKTKQTYEGRTKDTEFYTRIPKDKLAEIIQDAIGEQIRVWSRYTGKSPEEKIPKEISSKYNDYIDKLSKYFSDEDIDRRIEKDETKSNKRSVRRAIDNDTYKKLLEEEAITEEQLEKIASSVGVKLPKKVFDPSAIKAKEYKNLYDKIYLSLPSVNKEVLSKMIDDIKEGFKPLEKIIYDEESKWWKDSVKEFLAKPKVTDERIENMFRYEVSFWNKIFKVGKEEREKKSYIDERGRDQTETTIWYSKLSLIGGWEDVIDKQVLSYIEALKVQLIHTIISHFIKITQPIESIKQRNLEVGKKGFEGSYDFKFKNGSSFTFNTEAIGAGGYNIQRYHFRYLSHFKNIILADGSKSSDSSMLSILRHFSTAESLEMSNPYNAVRKATSPVQMIDAIYGYLMDKKPYGISHISKTIITPENGGGAGIAMRTKNIGLRFSMYLHLFERDGLEKNRADAIKFLQTLRVQDKNTIMASGGETPTPIMELLKHLYKEHHNDFAIAKDLEATMPLDAEMNSERVIEMWEKEIEEHFKEEEEVIFPRLKAMNITLTSDVESLIDTHNKFRNDIIPQVREKKNRASVLRFAHALKEHILDEEKLFKTIMPDPYKQITADDMEKGGETMSGRDRTIIPIEREGSHLELNGKRIPDLEEISTLLANGEESWAYARTKKRLQDNIKEEMNYWEESEELEAEANWLLSQMDNIVEVKSSFYELITEEVKSIHADFKSGQLGKVVNEIDENLTGDVQWAIDDWIGLPLEAVKSGSYFAGVMSERRLEELFQKKPDAIELFFEPAKEYLRAKYGDYITLFRSEDVKFSDRAKRYLISYTSNPLVAETFYRKGKSNFLMERVPLEDIVWITNRFNQNEFIVKAIDISEFANKMSEGGEIPKELFDEYGNLRKVNKCISERYPKLYAVQGRGYLYWHSDDDKMQTALASLHSSSVDDGGFAKASHQSIGRWLESADKVMLELNKKSGKKMASGGEVDENNYFQNNEAEFEIINEEEYDSIDSEEYVSESGSKYKNHNGILYRGADHWGSMETVDWTLRNREYVDNHFKGELDAGLDGYDKIIYGKVALSEMKKNSNQLIVVEPVIRRIIKLLKKNGHQALIVGGAVRDALLKIEPKDIDIEVYNISYTDLEKYLSPFGSVDLIGRTFGTILFKPEESESGLEYDFSVPRKENKMGTGHKGFEVFFDPNMTIKDAGERRDFSMNSLAYDPIENKIYDYYGGVDDIKNKIIKHTSDKFDQDYLRIMRLMNFESRLGFEAHPDTIAIVRRMLASSNEFNELPKKRLFDEWMKWAVKGVRHDLIFKFMRDTTLIDYYPELKALKETPQDTIYHPEGDVEIHTAMTLIEMDKIIERENIQGEEKAILIMSILLHDIGKPATTKEEMKRGRMTITSNGHEALGGDMAKPFLAGIGFHEELIIPISNIVANHLAGVSISQITARSGQLKAVKKLSRRLHPATIQQLLYVMEADSKGRGGDRQEVTGASIITELAKEANVQDKQYEYVLMGRHLIKRGLKPSPKFGEILRKAEIVQENGEFSDVEGGEKWLDANWDALLSGEYVAEKMLLAPNGKPSNLTPEQYALVRTPEFKKFFGDWEAFAKAKTLGDNITGIYKATFKGYEEQVLFEMAQQANTGEDRKAWAIKMVGEEFVGIALKLYPHTKVGEDFYSVVSKVVDENGEPIVLYHGSKEQFTEFKKEHIGKNTSAEMIEYHGKGFYFSKSRISETGYGVHEYPAFLNLRENDVDGMFPEPHFGISYYVAFHPEQIKLADGTNKTFNPNNPDIRYVDGGGINTTKTSSGNYEGEYKGVKFTIHKVEQIDSNTKNQWYWKIGKDGGDDWHSSKSIAILAVKEYIDEVRKEKSPKTISGGFCELIGKKINERGSIEVDGIERDAYEMIGDFYSYLKEYPASDEEVSELMAERFGLDDSVIKDKKELGRKIFTYLDNNFSSKNIMASGGNVVAEDSKLVNVYIDVSLYPFQVQSYLNPDEVKNVVIGKYPDYEFFEYKSVQYFKNPIVSDSHARVPEEVI